MVDKSNVCHLGDGGCNQCVYKITQKNTMIKHVCSKHKGVGYYATSVITKPHKNYIIKQQFRCSRF